MTRVVRCLLCGLLLGVPGVSESDSAQELTPDVQPDLPVVSGVRIAGATVYTPAELQQRHGLKAGEPLPAPTESIAEAIQRQYRSGGYTFAEITAAIDGDVLVVEIDEGQIDGIAFRGVSDDVAERLRVDFAVQPGDVFNRHQAIRALDQALEVAQGAIARIRSRDTFELVRENGRRILQVNLRTRGASSALFVGTQGREDWYSPVDGFNPAVGFQSTVFDSRRFNHAYWAGYLSYKFAADRAGYSFGLERPFFADGILQVGASLQDVTASDDQWRLGDAEQSLVALGFRNSFRDYYRRKGYQVHAAVRPLAGHEWLVAWRDESHYALANTTEYGFFRDDHPFRANAAAAEGDLRALIVGYTFDSRGLAGDTPGERFRRHRLDSLFGADARRDHGARLEWTSELAPTGLDHDFDFSRHILNARIWIQASPARMLSGRFVTGGSTGSLPPQRLFALGGIGTVHGYAFKEAAGDRMVLLNGEFRQRFGRSDFAGLAFIDAGRVYRPVAGSTEAWLKGVGVGLELGSSRIEFGWRLDDIPSSLQVLFRLGPTF